MMSDDAAHRRRTVSTTPITFNPMTAKRLHNQIERALRRTYAATTGLRILVGLSTREMLAAGASRDDIRRAVADCVLTHPLPVTNDQQTKATNEWQAEMLITSMLEWVDATCASAVGPQRVQ